MGAGSQDCLLLNRPRVAQRTSPHLQMLARIYTRPQSYHRKLCRTLSVSRIYCQKKLSDTRDLTGRRDADQSCQRRDTKPWESPYQLIEDTENLDRYTPGGYHPVHISDELNDGRYRIVDKLGHGGYSTIWLARDLMRARYVAVKIIIADASDCAHEASILNSLGKSTQKGHEAIPSLLDEFNVTGPNGTHKCIVIFPAQMSLFDSKEASTFRLFQPKVARSITAQLIQAIGFLHSRKTVHGGT